MQKTNRNYTHTKKCAVCTSFLHTEKNFCRINMELHGLWILPPFIVIFTSSKVGPKYGFLYFFENFWELYFCFQRSKYTFKPHNTIYQVKGLCSNFSKILKFFEVGQLHALEGFLTERNRKNAKYMIRTNGQNPPPRGVMRKIFLLFLLPL